METLVDLLRGRHGDRSGPGQPDRVSELFEQGIEELSKDLPPLSSLPSDFSRADVYDDHF
ncbi:MAG: hypothetical protein U0835_19970 [Isosphaeraceae bacterium]